ncbi:MAG: alpha/beta fold hydrolase [Anaerolineales bacterium]|nr:alpha/beta fold hydrolase [Anaerolineales bacterium]
MDGQILEKFKVGAKFKHYEDDQRRNWLSGGSRPLLTCIWYPADSNIRASRQSIAIFRTGYYKNDAPISDARPKFPLVVVSHGTGGSSASMAWICTRLASAGFIVASVNHHGNTGVESRLLLEGFMLCWERAADIRLVVDNVLADKDFGPHIDENRIGIAGFSMGGYTALAAVGAQLEIERWQPYCAVHPTDPICTLPPEAKFETREVWDAIESNTTVRESWSRANLSYRDARLKCAFVLAPVAGPILGVDSLKAIRVPVSLTVGEADDQSVPEQNALAFSKSIPDSSLEILPGVGHYTFLSEGTWKGRFVAPILFRDPKGIRRREIHEYVGAKAVKFFEESMG